MTRLSSTFVLVGVLALSLTLPAMSQANVEVARISNDADPVPLASFASAKCQKATKKKALLKFIATAKNRGYTLHVNIYRSVSSSNMLTYGSDGDAEFTVSGPGGSWSNLNRPPNAPPGGGAIAFNGKRTRMGLGFSPAFSDNLSTGISVAGGLNCKYPKKKKKKRR